MTSDKRALRTRMRTIRAGVVPVPLAVPAALLARLSADTVLASYSAVGGEPDPAPLVAAALAHACRVVLPHVVDRATPIRFLDWDGDGALEAGPFGLRQPFANATERRPDIILTPLVAFDRRGNRVGQGGGHYDRAFAAFPHAWRIGIAWSVQDAGMLIPDPWDMPLHAILTEREWIEP